MPYVETPSLKVHYRVGGSGETPIVLIHGNYASSRWWDPLLSSVPDPYYILAPDLRGCGSKDHHSTRTGMVTKKITVEDLVEDLRAFHDALEIEEIVLVGHSFGGQIAATYAIKYPERVKALVLEDTGPAWGITLGTATSPILLTMEIKNRQILRRALMKAGSPRNGPLAEALLEDALSAPRGLYYQFSRAAAAWKGGEELQKITAPTLLIWGEKDRVMPSRYATAYQKLILDSQLVLIPEAGHSPHLEQPIRYKEALYGFLDERQVKGRKTSRLEPIRKGLPDRLKAIRKTTS